MKSVFFCLCIQSCFSESFQDLFNVALVLHNIVGVDQDVVQVDYYTHIQEVNTSFMKFWKAAGVLISPNGITDHLKASQQVWKAVFHSSSSAMQTKWYAYQRLILVQIRAFRRESKRSEMRGSGYWSFFVILLSLQKFTQSRRDPSFFFMNRTGTPCGDNIEWMNPLVRFSSMNSFSASCSNLNKEQMVPTEGQESFSRSIRRS